jgi:hypothetical protein
MVKSKVILGGGDSLFEAMKNMENRGKFEIEPSREKCMYVIADKSDTPFIDEGEDGKDKWEKYLFNSERGGTIVFSTDVNSLELSKSAFKNRLMQIYETFKNRRFALKMLDKVRRRNDVYAWTIGRYLVGTYTGNDGKTYNENSISIDVVGIGKDTLFKIAEQLKDEFKQESVLVKWDNQVYFVS